jgi:hypothetical protein
MIFKLLVIFCVLYFLYKNLGNIIINYNILSNIIRNYLGLDNLKIIKIETNNKSFNNIYNFSIYYKNNNNKINNINVLYKLNNKHYIIMHNNDFLFSYKLLKNYNSENKAFSTTDNDILLININDDICNNNNIINYIKMLSGPKGNFYKDIVNINYNKLVIKNLIKKFPKTFNKNSLINILMSDGNTIIINN